MEQHHTPDEGPEQQQSQPPQPVEPEAVALSLDVEALDLPPPSEAESWDERVIREGIAAAVREGRPIDNRTARYIAGQLHGGQASALYALASSGAIQPEVFAEMDQDRTEQPEQTRIWLASLTVYCAFRGASGPIDGWVEQAEAQDRVDLMQRISAVGVTTLGQVVTVHIPVPLHGGPAADDEGDTFGWDDSARWSPDDDGNADVSEAPELSDAQVEALFSEQADEEIGDVNDLGWYGLVRWPDRPGGIILRLDEQGLRHTWVVASDAALTTRWADITNAYGEFYEQRDAYEEVTNEPELTPSGICPKVWVGSLADYVNGELHGEWFDATHEPAVLELAATHMLRLSRSANAEEWFIADYDGFDGAELGEYESFGTVSRIARGIAEHGEAFGHWAGHVGSESTEQIERFADHYRGEWDSFEAYIRDYLEETEFYRFLEHVPEDMHGYIEVDVERMARDWSYDYYTVLLGNGRIAIFDAAL